MDLDEDGFSARSRLLELLEDFDASKNNKRIVEFCASQSGFALDLLQIMIDQILETNAGKRKALVQILQSILIQDVAGWSDAFKSQMPLRLQDISKTVSKDQSTSAADIVLKWADQFGVHLLPEVKERLSDLVAAGAGNEAERKRRQGIIDLMEKDRAAHKVKRDELWSRPKGESREDEFMGYFKKAKKLSAKDESLLARNQAIFLSLNDRQKAVTKTRMTESTPIISSRLKRSHSGLPVPKKREQLVFVFDIEDSFVYLDCFLTPKAPENIRAIAKKLDDYIIDIAVALFFYTDLKKFEQPSIDFLSAFDDGRPLHGFDFGHDRLAMKDPHPEDPQYQLERAYRSRLMRERFNDSNHLKGMGPEFLRRLDTYYQDLDTVCNQMNSLAQTFLTLLSGKPDTKLYIVAPRSLPRLFALLSAFRLDAYIPPEHIYSSLPFERHWCLADIKARYVNDPETRFILCGAHEDCKKDAKELGYEFIKIRSKAHMMEFAKTFKL